MFNWLSNIVSYIDIYWISTRLVKSLTKNVWCDTFMNIVTIITLALDCNDIKKTWQLTTQTFKIKWKLGCFHICPFKQTKLSPLKVDQQRRDPVLFAFTLAGFSRFVKKLYESGKPGPCQFIWMRTKFSFWYTSAIWKCTLHYLEFRALLLWIKGSFQLNFLILSPFSCYMFLCVVQLPFYAFFLYLHMCK